MRELDVLQTTFSGFRASMDCDTLEQLSYDCHDELEAKLVSPHDELLSAQEIDLEQNEGALLKAGLLRWLLRDEE